MEPQFLPLRTYIGTDGKYKPYEPVTVDGGYLPEIIITPTKHTHRALKKLKQIIPNKQLRKQVMNSRYNKNDEYDTIDRMHDLWKRAGKPKTQHFSEQGFLDKLIQPIMNAAIGSHIDRAHYNAPSNTMTIGSFNDFVEELPHAYQYYNNNVPKGGFLNTGFGLPGDIKIGGKNGYNRYSNQEFFAHNIVEPFLEDYLFNANEAFSRDNSTLNAIDEVISDVYNHPGDYGIKINNDPKQNIYNTSGKLLPRVRR